MPAADKFLTQEIFDGNFDRTLLLVSLVLTVFGLIMIYSATVDGRISAAGVGAYYFIGRQAIFFIAAVAVSFCGFALFSMRQIEKWALLAALLSLVLLALVLFIGTKHGQTRRWISVFGLFNIQPAEFFKLTMILYMADFLNRNHKTLNKVGKTFAVMIIPAVGCGLILKGGDLGSVVIIAVVFVSMLFSAGWSWRWIVVAMLVLTVMAAAAIFITPYRVERILIFRHPDADPFGAGYQTVWSLVANAHGSLWGTGLGYGMARYFLPELHTDFIGSLIAEEMGFIFLTVLILVYVWIWFRGYAISNKSKKMHLFYSAYAAQGIVMLLLVQAVIHIGVNTGLLPTKGLTLPFISYGGSSLLVSALAIAFLLRIDYENRRKSRGYRV